MIELNIDERVYTIAESWDEIYFSQYVDIINLNKDEGMNDLSKAVKIIALISDKPESCEKDLLNLSREDFEELASNFEWTNKPIDNFKTDTEYVEIDGKKYKIKKDYSKLTLGEMISVETLIANNKNLDPLEIVFGVLLREEIDGKEKEFNEDDFIHIISELKSKVLLLDIYNYISFFLSGDKKSTTKNSKAFSIQKKAKSSSPVE